MSVTEFPQIDFQTPPTIRLIYIDSGLAIFACPSSPEGIVSAAPGSLAIDAGGNWHRKGSGIGPTGWVDVGGGGGGVILPLNYPPGVKQPFAPNATNAGVNVGQVATNPTNQVNGDLFYNSSTGQLFAIIQGAPVDLGAAGAGNVNAPNPFTLPLGLVYWQGSGFNVQTALGLALEANQQSLHYQPGARQVFAPSGNNAGVNVGSIAGDPAVPVNGDIWYNSTTNQMRARVNGANVTLA